MPGVERVEDSASLFLDTHCGEVTVSALCDETENRVEVKGTARITVVTLSD